MTTKLDNDSTCKKSKDLISDKDSNDISSNDSNIATKSTLTNNDKSTTFSNAIPDKLEQQYSDHHPVPSPTAHHAPPEDSTELLSPWWSEESPDTTHRLDTDHPPPEQQHPQSNTTMTTTSPDDEYTRYIITYGRSATDPKGNEVWREDCMIWTKDPSKVSQVIETAIERKGTSTDASPCTMVCLFRQSQERRKKKREALSSWNPFYGNWLVVTHTHSALAEHVQETDIIKKNSPNYYTIELGERIGRLDEDVAKFMKRTFTPVQNFGQRYMNSWKDGTQADFFTRFLTSAQRGDGFFLLRDSVYRMMESVKGSDEKKNGGGDHK
ncbi:hypothetical protein BC941DRAFT_434428 [Chlamydoabsidia padenii]|nr:hypothetical protein BC941DRAFT_434428 [Chlamydoabsidia padenii]